MSTDQTDPQPAYTITFDGPVTPFAINEEAFSTWIAASDPDDCYWSLPSTDSENPSGDLYRLLEEAQENDVIVSDARLDLQLCGDEDADSSGFWVHVVNRGSGRQIALLGGWSAVSYPAADAELAAATREQLAHVISLANSILPQP